MSKWKYDGSNDHERFERFTPKRRSPTKEEEDKQEKVNKPIRGGKRELSDEDQDER